MDINILLFLQSIRNGIFDIFFTIITHLGDAGAIWILLFGILLIKKETRSLAIWGFIVLIMDTIIVSGIIKPIVSRPRPFVSNDITPIIKAPFGYSFPSGHAASSFAAATYLYFKNFKYKKVVLILAFLIAFSRLYVFVHYPSDVLVGAIIGSSIGYIGYRLSIIYPNLLNYSKQ